jgi:lipopolysaccharide/colanic/teichoic acid biosynthesis glycosyltransferase
MSQAVRELMLDVANRAAAVAALTILAPLGGVLALAVKATSRGPILFSDERMGKAGRPFRMLKFRSMRSGAELIVSKDLRTVVEKTDNRLTPIGALLRLGFDELPQLINVVRGEMHLVGPRPDPTWMLSHYTPNIRRRLNVKPGITGLSQVCHSKAFAPAVGYLMDAYYVEHRSLTLDLRVILLTFPYLLKRERPGGKMRAHILETSPFTPDSFIPITKVPGPA